VLGTSSTGLIESHSLTGSDIALVTTGFSKNLSSADTTVQLAMNTLDALVTSAALPAGSITGDLLYWNGTVWTNTGGYVIYNNSTNEIEITSVGKGIIMKSPNGNRFRLNIENTGDLQVTSL